MSATVRVENVTRGVVLGSRIEVADRWWSRARGLLGRAPLRPGEGLLIFPCPAVHTFAMKYPIDVAILDGERRVLSVHHSLPPGSRTSWIPGGRFALELPVGTLSGTGTQPGDLVRW